MQVQQDFHNSNQPPQPNSMSQPPPPSDQPHQTLPDEHLAQQQHQQLPPPLLDETQKQLLQAPQLKNNQNLRPEELAQLLHILKKNNLPLENPTLRLDIIPNQTPQQQHIAASFGPNSTNISADATDYTLSEQDVRTTFEAFGELKDVYVIESEPQHAIIVFDDFIQAYICQQSLNNFNLKLNNVTLLVKWVPQQRPETNDEGQEFNNVISKQASFQNNNHSDQQQQPGQQHAQPHLQQSNSGNMIGQQQFNGSARQKTLFEEQTVFQMANGPSSPSKSNQNNNLTQQQVQQPRFYQQNSAQMGPAPQQLQMQQQSSSQMQQHHQQQQQMQQYYQTQPIGQASQQRSVPSSGIVHQQQQQSQQQQMQQQQQQSQQNQNDCDEMEAVKYTCRFEIQIENDKEFQVARRLIGSKGCNMKRIIEFCSKNLPPGMQNDVVKLRLRGKGSQFKEGPKQEESKEPLHLCISSRFFDKYQIACQMYQELLLNVYEEYKKFCERQKRDLRIVDEKGNLVVNSILQIKKSEFVTGRRAQVQPLPNMYQANPQSAPTVPNTPKGAPIAPKAATGPVPIGGSDNNMQDIALSSQGSNIKHSNTQQQFMQQKSGYPTQMMGGGASKQQQQHPMAQSINTGSVPFHPGSQ